jgi:hypothetical protein
MDCRSSLIGTDSEEVVGTFFTSVPEASPRKGIYDFFRRNPRHVQIQLKGGKQYVIEIYKRAVIKKS